MCFSWIYKHSVVSTFGVRQCITALDCDTSTYRFRFAPRLVPLWECGTAPLCSELRHVPIPLPFSTTSRARRLRSQARSGSMQKVLSVQFLQFCPHPYSHTVPHISIPKNSLPQTIRSVSVKLLLHTHLWLFCFYYHNETWPIYFETHT